LGGCLLIDSSWELVGAFSTSDLLITNVYIGVGADYPLSASLTAEFAASKHRARMLASVFFSQALGYFFAILFAQIVLSGYSSYLPNQDRICDEHCRAALDNAWRIIVGLGIIPTLIAIYFRRKIPESTLYTVLVLNRVKDAVTDLIALSGRPGPPPRLPTGNTPPRPQHVSPPTAIRQENNDPHSRAEREVEAQSFRRRFEKWREAFRTHFITKGHWPKLAAISLAWCLFDCAYYALLGSSATTVATKIFNVLPPGSGCTFNGTDAFDTWPPPFEHAPNCTNLSQFNSPSYPSGPYVQHFRSGFVNMPWRVFVTVSIGSLAGGATMIYLTKFLSPKRVQISGFLTLSLLFAVVGAILVTTKGHGMEAGSILIYLLAQFFFELGPNFTTFSLAVELFPTELRASSHGIAAASGKLGACLFQTVIQYASIHYKGQVYQWDTPGTVWLGLILASFIPIMLLGALVTHLFIPETRIGMDEGSRDVTLTALEQIELPASGARFLRFLRIPGPWVRLASTEETTNGNMTQMTQVRLNGTTRQISAIGQHYHINSQDQGPGPSPRTLPIGSPHSTPEDEIEPSPIDQR
jgi:PHS family inorganic phosphate transporter-like MFS transporter